MIDTHQHLLNPKRFNYAWAKDFPALKGELGLDQYRAAAEGCGIEGTVFMEVDACPDVTFVLDQCGVPDIAANSSDFWKKQTKALAKRSNVACKVSGVTVYASEDQRTADGLFPWFAHVPESFGSERLVWGGNKWVPVRWQWIVEEYRRAIRPSARSVWAMIGRISWHR